LAPSFTWWPRSGPACSRPGVGDYAQA
ncbi:hypothetical protein A2U01_0109796, partial [Trifolium medium]|nr:hypothetical protein [Trifolium medium]